jgi:FAD/FMN-containing dehydrogenase
MTPKFVAFPLDVADIAAAIGYAKQNSLRVVARSGGHHYSGLSSGGSSTLLLSMDSFRSVTRGADNLVEVGVAVSLESLSSFLVSQHLSMPHGECPLVNIGGHVQTGGLGHLMSTFGLALDRCVAFHMVTADGRDQWYQRSATDANERQTYAAVMGGGPGSWGVLTRLRFDCIADAVYPDSYGYQRVFKYNQSAVETALLQWSDWTSKVEPDRAPRGVDFTLSVVSGWGWSLKRPFALLLVEGIDVGNDPARRDVFRAYANAIDAKALRIPLAGYDGEEPLSSMVHSIVRQRGTGTTYNGREFPGPFKKRVVVFRKAMTPAFAHDFAALVDQTMDMGLRVVVQLLAGGNAYRSPPSGLAATRAQFRSLTFALVFDVFSPDDAWKPSGSTSEQSALAQQAKMRALMTKHSLADLRMFWGSYEENDDQTELDMSLPKVVAMYYDSTPAYQQLQTTKKRLDPTDLFHTSFTVQLPN